jgi:hypothetical protein
MVRKETVGASIVNAKANSALIEMTKSLRLAALTALTSCNTHRLCCNCLKLLRVDKRISTIFKTVWRTEGMNKVKSASSSWMKVFWKA